MNKDLAAQFLSAIITRNSGQRIEDDVKEALAYAETFERLTADYITPQAVQELIQNPPLEQKKWTLNFNRSYGQFLTKQSRNDALVCLLDGYAKSETITFLVASNNGILSNWTDKDKLFEYYKNEKEVHVIECFTEEEIKQQIDAYYEERGGFAKHVEYLKSIGQW